MKKIFFLAVTILISSALEAQTKYTIKGVVPKSSQATKAVMSYPPDDNGGEYRADTVLINTGKFEFKGEIGRPQLAELNLIIPRNLERNRAHGDQEGNNMKNVALFYLDGSITIRFDEAGQASYSGGGQEEKTWRAYEHFAIAKSKELTHVVEGMDFYQNMIKSFVELYPDRHVSVDLMEMFAQDIQPKTFSLLYNMLSERMRNQPKALVYKTKLEAAIKAQSGEMEAPTFVLNDVDGNPVSLESYRGKYVLVDFWASWCVPCRAENPNVIAAYEEFKDKNFDVLGISLDTKKEAWLMAIKEDKLPWKQVCDFKADKSEVSKVYEISSIPANFLIDPNGKIVGKNLRDKALHERLAELLK